MVKHHSPVVSGRAEELKEEKPFYKTLWFKTLSYTLAGLVALTGIGYAVSNYLSRNIPAYKEPPAIVTPASPLELPQSILNQLSYLPDNVRTILIGELKTETDWDRDSIINGQDSYVLDPSNTIAQPKYHTINFIKDLKKQNEDKLLPQVYHQFALALYTVDSNPEYFQETNPDRAHVTVRLVDGISAITKYPRALSLAAVQVDSQKLTDDYAIVSYIIPAIAYIVKLQDEKSIDVLNGLNIQNKQLEETSIRQILLPEELRYVNIRTGERYASGINYQGTEQDKMKIGIFNVTPNPELNGSSPQEWLREIAVRDFNDKNSWYWKRHKGAYGVVWPLSDGITRGGLVNKPAYAWPNSDKSFIKRVEQLIKEGDELTLFICDGWARGPPPELNPSLYAGQTTPYYSVLVGRSFGIPVFVVRSIYPTSSLGREEKHDEPFVMRKNGELFGYWSDEEAFFKDYEGKLVNPWINFVTWDGSAKPYTWK